MLDHVSIQCADLAASTAFYDTVLGPLGATRLLETGSGIGYGVEFPCFWLGPQRTGAGFRESHLAFRASGRDAVRTFRDAAVSIGAEILHEPRVWPEYHPGYYGAFVRDPDGNNVEAVHHTFTTPDPVPPGPPAGSTVIPSIRFRDENVAVDWLCEVFGFGRHRVVPTADGGLAHAELTAGTGMVMIGTIGDETHDVYVVVADADHAYARARAAGVEMVRDLRDEDYGGRSFACRDLEGHTWSFGTYNPWTAR
ncbi:MAG: hypothetical protein AMXMBFR46_18340 [Acidimicrobiia bacterium]